MVIKDNCIMYFSGTGNTYDIVVKIGRECNLKPIFIGDLLKEEVVEIDCDILGIAFPVYCGGVPNIVNKIIEKLIRKSKVYTFAITTYAGMPGDPFKILENKLVKKDINLNSTFLFRMPQNYIILKGAGSKESQIRKLNKAYSKIPKAVKIIRNKEDRYEKSPFIIDRPFSKFSDMRVKSLNKKSVNFNIDNKCIKCGACVKMCPVDNIKIEKDNVIWLDKCEQCMTCIQYCSKEAIQYGKKTSKRKRYRNVNAKFR